MVQAGASLMQQGNSREGLLAVCMVIGQQMKRLKTELDKNPGAINDNGFYAEADTCHSWLISTLRQLVDAKPQTELSN